MTPEEAQLICQERLGLRVGPEMSQYIAKRVASADVKSSIPVIGGDARTGIPARRAFPVAGANDEQGS